MLGEYQNGNYAVRIYEDGTKIRFNNLDHLTPDFPECIDLNVSNKCPHRCEYCYQGNSPDGDEADLEFLLHVADGMHPYTEIAINLNSGFTETILAFLRHCRERRVIVNLTLSQKDFITLFSELRDAQKQDLIHGIGVSYTSFSDELLSKILSLNNVVLHCIVGITTFSDIIPLFDQGVKVLWLGFKKKGRGFSYYKEHQEKIFSTRGELILELPTMLKHLSVVSFDNLAIEQLKLKESGLVKDWDRFYMGDDGKYTFYIDGVRKKFYRSSLESTGYSCGKLSVKEMFKRVLK